MKTSRFPYIGSWCVLSTVVTQYVMAAVCFQTMFVPFLGFQLSTFSQLGHLPICVICVASISVSSVSNMCVICIASLSFSYYVCHIMCVTLCVSHYVCLIMCVSLCVSHYMNVTPGSKVQKSRSPMYAICDKYCMAHGCATRKNQNRY